MSDEDLLVFPGGGRLRSVDDRDLNHLLPPRGAAPTPVLKHFQYWSSPDALDQGESSSCVGHGWHQFLRCSPIRNTRGIPGPYEIYNAAQLIDEWPGIDPEILGTSVRAGAKVLVKGGFLSAYRWAFDGATVVNHLLSVGPMVIGTDWMSGMMQTDKHGYITPKGSMVGGHCTIVVGVNTLTKNPDGTIGSATILNSWSPKWGVKGRAKITLPALDQLIRANGEACAATEVYKPVAA